MTEEEEPTPEPAALPAEQEDRIVDRVINAVKSIVAAPKELLPDDEELPDDDDPPAKEPHSVREIENDMESQVRNALKKIGAEEEHAKEHEKLKVEVERPPVTVGKVTRTLWGSGEDK